jgi:hypothetical protein
LLPNGIQHRWAQAIVAGLPGHVYQFNLRHAHVGGPSSQFK